MKSLIRGKTDIKVLLLIFKAAEEYSSKVWGQISDAFNVTYQSVSCMRDINHAYMSAFAYGHKTEL